MVSQRPRRSRTKLSPKSLEKRERTLRAALNQKKDDHRIPSPKSKTEGEHMFYASRLDLFEAAEAMSTGISEAISKLKGFLPMDPLPLENAGTKHLLSKAKLTNENLLSDIGEEKKEDPFAHDDNLTISDVGLPPIQHFDARAPSEVSSGFSSEGVLHRPIPIPATEASASSVFDEVCSSHIGYPITEDETGPNDEADALYSSSSPMARIRYSRSQQSAGLNENRLSPRSPKFKSHEEIKAEKQRKWKRKMKLAKRRQLEERQALEGDDPETVPPDGFFRIVMSKVHESKKILRLMQARCGILEDALSDSDDSVVSVSSNGSSSSGGDESRASDCDIPAQKNGDSAAANLSFVNRDLSAAEKASRRSIPSSRSPQASSAELIRQTSVSGNLLDSFRGKISRGDDSPSNILLDPEIETRSKAKLYTYNQDRQSPPETPPTPPDVERIVTSDMTEINPKDKAFIRAFIQLITTEGFSLHWHKEAASMNPSKIKMIIKRGYRTLNGSHCGPRLVWADRKDPEDVYGIDLFDIRSLEKASAIHLKDYPFAIPGRSMFLTLTRGGDFVFEASTEQHAHRFIHGMRWIVARLTFNLIIGNLDVSCELLDLVQEIDGTVKQHPDSSEEEASWTKAMDEVTNQLVDKTVFP